MRNAIWKTVYFDQSSESEVLEYFEEHGAKATINYLLDAGLHPDESDSTDLKQPWGNSDDVYRHGRYVLSVNTRMGYIGLQYKIKKGVKP